VRDIWIAEQVPGEVELAICRTEPGPGDLDAVVCLHGITAQHRAFNALARDLRGARPLIGLDLRGRGNSGQPPSGYGLAAHANDVIRVLDHLGLEDAILAGHSMGAFVALRTALDHPNRVRALVLLDGGWPRVEDPPQEETPEGEGDEEGGEAAAVKEGLARAFARLDMVFESPEEYLDFWFPGQGLTPDDLPPELADYYLYDLERVEGGYNPKASLAAAQEDTREVTVGAPTLEEIGRVRCPAALVMAAEGFFPGTSPLISEETRALMTSALDVRYELRVGGANHYTLLWPEHTPRWAHLLRDVSWCR
jgi:pimeloyl-ACP methyl ester carboxylesterase